MPREDESPLTTERVQVSRRGPLVVSIVALSVVGLLVWKPWAAPLPPTSSPVAALPAPTGAPTVTPAPGSTTEVGEVVDPGFVVFQCSFPGGGVDGSLSAIALGPPVIHLLLDDSRVRYVSWHAEIQANRIDKVFEADWQTIVDSPAQLRDVANVHSVRFDPTRIAWNHAADELMVLRPTFVVEWFDRRHAVIGSAQIAPRIFGPDREGFRIDEGCTIT